MPKPSGLVMVLLFTWIVETPVLLARPAGPSSACTAIPADPAFTVGPLLLTALLLTNPLNVPLPPKNTEMPSPSAFDIGLATVPLLWMLKLLRPFTPLNDTAIALLPTLSTSLPLISTGVAAAPRVPVVALLALPLPPATLIPLPPMKIGLLKNSKPEIVLLLIVPVVRLAVVLADPCAKTWIPSCTSAVVANVASLSADAMDGPDTVLLEMFTLAIVPFQVSIMIAFRRAPEIKLSVMIKFPLTVFANTAGSTNAMALSLYWSTTAVPVFVIWPLSNVKFVTLVPLIPLLPMSWIDILTKEGLNVFVSEIPWLVVC